MIPHISSDISLGNIIAAASFLVAAVVAWRDLNWRIKNIEVWIANHTQTSKQTQDSLVYLRDAAISLKEIAAGQDRRLQILEDRNALESRLRA